MMWKAETQAGQASQSAGRAGPGRGVAGQGEVKDASSRRTKVVFSSHCCEPRAGGQGEGCRRRPTRGAWRGGRPGGVAAGHRPGRGGMPAGWQLRGPAIGPIAQPLRLRQA